MSNLVKQDGEGAATMTSREIAELVGLRHDNVKRTIEALYNQEVIAQPQIEDVQEVGGNNRTYTTQLYVFSGEKGKRDSIVVVAQLSPEFTARLVDRWQELEQNQSQPVVNPAQLSRMQLLLLAMEAEEEKLALEAKVEEQAPKVEALERISEATGAVTLTNAAKILQQQPRKFNDWLHSIGWIYRRLGRNQWTAYQEHIKLGRLTHKVHAYIDGETGESRMSEQVLVTPRGIAQLSKLLNEPPLGNMPLNRNAYLEARGC